MFAMERDVKMLQISDAHTGEGLEEVKALFEEYATSLAISLDFQGFDSELESLPGYYAPPQGCILLASWEGQVAGCVALRKLEEGICEMKRLFTRPGFRGHRIGHALSEAVIQRAREIGYSRMRLDTLESMGPARKLYTSLGFYEIGPYCYNPIADAVYMELQLSAGEENSR